MLLKYHLILSQVKTYFQSFFSNSSNQARGARVATMSQGKDVVLLKIPVMKEKVTVMVLVMGVVMIIIVGVREI